jgi:glyoxylase-like metal-dependent hydrolase (beta-lactamase superfamily II)
MIHTIDLHFLGIPNTIAAFLVETSEGPVLIETGPHSTISALENGVRSAGYSLEDIAHVFLTHIHLDHAGAAWAMAQKGAMVYVHPEGERHLLQPEKLIHSAKLIYKDQMDALWGGLYPIEPSKLKVVNHREVVRIGHTDFVAWHTPGHAVHHIAWQVEDNVFSGDIGGVKINGGIVVPPCPPPDIQIESWLESIELLKSLPVKKMYLTHYGPIEDIVAHLEALKTRLLSWTAWMKTPFEQGSDHVAVTEAFSKFVAGELAEAKMDKQTLLAYEFANPAWMSVAGLMRYWKKRTSDGQQLS